MAGENKPEQIVPASTNPDVIDEQIVPMFTTAEFVVSADDGIEPLILSLFPEADEHQIRMMKLFAVAQIMEGIEIGRGLEASGATDDVNQARWELTGSHPVDMIEATTSNADGASETIYVSPYSFCQPHRYRLF